MLGLLHTKVMDITFLLQDTSNFLFHTGLRYLDSFMASCKRITHTCKHISDWISHHPCATPSQASLSQETTSLILPRLGPHPVKRSCGNKYGTWQTSVDTLEICHTHDNAYTGVP